MPEYIKILRKFKEHPMWLMERFTYGQVWVDLLLLVYQKKTKRMKDGVATFLQKGQLLMSDFQFPERWKWTEQEVEKWFSQLEYHEMVKIQLGVLTITNWEKYQGKSQVSYGENEKDLIAALQTQIQSPALDGTYFQNAYYAKQLLKRSKTGKDGVLWLIKLINISDTYCPKVGSMKDLFNKFNKLVQYHHSHHQDKKKRYVSI